jgi:hypothetical protein
MQQQPKSIQQRAPAINEGKKIVVQYKCNFWWS